MNPKTLILIPGATGKMGETFFKKLNQSEKYQCIGLTSNPKKETKDIFSTNLLNKNEIKNLFKKINLGSYKEIYLIHSIGPFIFEEKGYPNKDLNNDGIDDEIYNLNFLTFKNIARELIDFSNKNKIHLTLVAFGSISDRYNVPWWNSYSKSKTILRIFIRESINKIIRGVFINVGSTEKEEERPYANKKYWLTCKEVMEKSIRPIFDKNLNWQEIDIFKPNPDYYKGFFENHEFLRKRWIHDMYGK